MEIKRTLVLDSSESISKALPQLDVAPAVLVTKNGRYYGIIDHRSLSNNIRLPHAAKCETAVTRAPVLAEGADMMARVEAFLVGHFKALPVVDERDKPLGITTRVELLEEMLGLGMVPAMNVDDLMSAPAFTIKENESIGAAKKALKEKKARRLVVTRNGILVGVVSTFDISAFGAKSNLLGSGRKDIKRPASINIDQMPISGFLRPDVTTVEEGSVLEVAVRRMIDKQVSHVIIVSGKKPVGVISALDVFRKVQELAEAGPAIAISGLRDDNRRFRERIEDKIGHVLDKFGKTFSIRNPSVHVKEGKSTFVINVYFDMERGHLSVKEEGKDLKETIDKVAAELNQILRKKKELRKPKPRAFHTR